MLTAGVELWLAHLDVAGPGLDALGVELDLLPEEERARAAHSPDPLQSQRWRRARVALRLVLATHAGLQRGREPFAVSPAGKPALASPSPITFSLSHSGPMLAVAVAADAPVGVDIETRTTIDMDVRRRGAIERAAQALAPHAPLPPVSSEAVRFLQAWTRLEALAKARGAGIGHLLTEVGVRGPASGLSGQSGQASADSLMIAGRRLRIEDLTLAGVTAAAAALPDDMTLAQRKIPASTAGLNELAALARARG